MATLTELELIIRQGFRDVTFSTKVLTAVVGFGTLANMWLVSAYHETEMRLLQQGQRIIQTTNVERQKTQTDLVESEVNRLNTLKRNRHDGAE